MDSRTKSLITITARHENEESSSWTGKVCSQVNTGFVVQCPDSISHKGVNITLQYFHNIQGRLQVLPGFHTLRHYE